MSAETLRRTAVPLLAALLLTGAGAGAVLAKCNHPEGAAETAPEMCEGVTATIDFVGPLTAGSVEQVGAWILEDESPYPAESVTFVFSRVADGTVIRVAASPTLPAGRWAAEVELPEGGSWTLAAAVRGSDYSGSFGLDTIQVRPPAVGPVDAGSPTSTGARPTGMPVALPWVVIGGLALVSGAAFAFTVRARQKGPVGTG